MSVRGSMRCTSVLLAMTFFGIAFAGSPHPVGPGKGKTADAADTQAGMLIQRRGYGVATNVEIDGYFNELLKSLQRTWPELPKPAHVYLTPDPALTAYGTNDGAIFIPYGTLESVQTEDELAALIGHEYAHILLDHHRTSVMTKASQVAYGLGMLYLGSKYGKSGANEIALLREFAYNELALQSIQSALYPAMTRHQESDADRLGVDLMIRAGYNPIGMATLLKRIGTWEAQQVAAGAARQQALIDAAGPVWHQSRTANRVEVGVNSAAISARVTAGVGSLMDKLRRQHKPAEERMEQMRSYLKSTHADALRPEMRTLPWQADVVTKDDARSFLNGIDTALKASDALGKPDVSTAQRLSMIASSGPAADSAYVRYTGVNVALAEGKKKQAEEALERHVATSHSLFAEHYLYLDAVQRDSPQKALSAWQRSDQLLGSPPELLPYAIRINRRAGNVSVASLYYVKCIALGIQDLRDSCDQANKGQ